jgi:secreted trypsin-like serine protease
MATLRVTAYHGNILAVSDRSAFGEQNKLSACNGDSGGPAYALRSSVPQLVGIIRGSFCGEGATYVTPLAPQRDWIVETARQWGSQLGP